jgi:hypothetical protein
MEWQDATVNESLTPGVFRDGAAVALPVGDAPAFFCMGQLDHYVNIWHWKADWQSDVDRRAARAKESKRKRKGPRRFEVIPRRPSSVEDLIGGGFSTLTSKQRQGRIKGQAEWKRGLWRVKETILKMKPSSFLVVYKQWLLRFGMEKTKNAMDRKRWRLGCNYKLIPLNLNPVVQENKEHIFLNQSQVFNEINRF